MWNGHLILKHIYHWIFYQGKIMLYRKKQENVMHLAERKHTQINTHLTEFCNTPTMLSVNQVNLIFCPIYRNFIPFLSTILSLWSRIISMRQLICAVSCSVLYLIHPAPFAVNVPPLNLSRRHNFSMLWISLTISVQFLQVGRVVAIYG